MGPHVRALIADVHDLPFRDASFDAVLVVHTLTCAERPAQALEERARVLRLGGRRVILSLDAHQQRDVTTPYGERHPGFSPSDIRAMLTRARLDVAASDVACREAKKPHFQVVLAIADEPTPGPSKSDKRV